MGDTFILYRFFLLDRNHWHCKNRQRFEGLIGYQILIFRHYHIPPWYLDVYQRQGDDGIHSGNNTVVSGGEINIAKCYEGREGQTVTVSGGKVTLTASDDGSNAAGGDNQGVGGGFGPDSFSADSEAKITITGRCV